MIKKRVKIQSNFPSKEVDRKMKSKGVKEIEREDYEFKKNGGRPKINDANRKEEEITIYCTKQQKRELYKYFKNSGKMRDVLLSFLTNDNGGK